MNFYAKNSFDRFSDDLTELILSYLTLEDKIRLECVTKRWRRLVFNKQYCLEIRETNDLLAKLMQTTNKRNLVSVLNKCPNITRFCIDFRVNSQVFLVIGLHCQHIKSLEFYGNGGKVMLTFARKYGHRLEQLIMYIDGHYHDYHKQIKGFLQFCPNLKKVETTSISDLIDDDKDFLPKLESIKLLETYPQQVNHMKVLSNKYSQTLKTLSVDFNWFKIEELKTCTDCISRFENLTELKLRIQEFKSKDPIDDCLSLIGQKCTKLLKLELLFYYSVPISKRFFNVFTQFIALKRLKIRFLEKTIVDGSVECFKQCKQLKELDINYHYLTEEFFSNIGLFVPKLQLLRIESHKLFSDSFIDSFHSLESIQKVSSIGFSVNYIQKDWYFGKCLTEVMLSPDGVNVKHITDNCGLILK